MTWEPLHPKCPRCGTPFYSLAKAPTDEPEAVICELVACGEKHDDWWTGRVVFYRRILTVDSDR